MLIKIFTLSPRGEEPGDFHLSLKELLTHYSSLRNTGHGPRCDEMPLSDRNPFREDPALALPPLSVPGWGRGWGRKTRPLSGLGDTAAHSRPGVAAQSSALRAARVRGGAAGRSRASLDRGRVLSESHRPCPPRKPDTAVAPAALQGGGHQTHAGKTWPL